MIRKPVGHLNPPRRTRNNNNSRDLDMISLNHVTHVISFDPQFIETTYTNIGVKYLEINGWPQDADVEEEIPGIDIETIIGFVEQAKQQGQSTLICSYAPDTSNSYTSESKLSRPFTLLSLYLMHHYEWTLLKSLQFLNSRIPNLTLKRPYFCFLKQEERQLLLQDKITSFNWEPVERLKEGKEDQIIIRNTFVNAGKGKNKQSQETIEKNNQVGFLIEADKKRYRTLNKDTLTRVTWLDKIGRGDSSSIRQDTSRKKIPPTPPLRQYNKVGATARVPISSLQITTQRRQKTQTSFSPLSKQRNDSENSRDKRFNKQITLSVRDIISRKMSHHCQNQKQNQTISLKKDILHHQTENKLSAEIKNFRGSQNYGTQKHETDIARLRNLLSKKHGALSCKYSQISEKNSDQKKTIAKQHEYQLANQNPVQQDRCLKTEGQVEGSREEKRIYLTASQQISQDERYTSLLRKEKLSEGTIQKHQFATRQTFDTANNNGSQELRDTVQRVIQRVLNSQSERYTNSQFIRNGKEKQNNFFAKKRLQSPNYCRQSPRKHSNPLKKHISESILNSKPKWR